MKKLEHRIARTLAEIPILLRYCISEIRRSSTKFLIVFILFSASIYYRSYAESVFKKYKYARDYRIEDRYSGFGLAYNYSSEFKPESFVMTIDLSQSFTRPRLSFSFRIRISNNNTYKVLIILPFKLAETPLSNEFNFTEIQQGTALSKEIKNYSDEPREINVGGSFYIENTFMHGIRSRYLVILPIQPSFGDINDLLNSLYMSSRNDFEFIVNLKIPSRYLSFNERPPISWGPNFVETDSLMISWDFSETRPEPISIFIESPIDQDIYQNYLFQSGLFYGISFPLLIQSLIEFLKELLGCIERAGPQ